MNRPALITVGLLTMTIALVAMERPIDRPPESATAIAPSASHELDDIMKWSPALERGTLVRYQHRLCDQERELFRQKTGAEPPDIRRSGELRTFGPLSGDAAQKLSRFFHQSGLDQIRLAERAKVETVEDAREQARDLLDGLKADLAARALLDGHYWTVEADAHPRLPEGWTFYAALASEKGPGGETLQVYAPLDLHAPELRTAYAAFISLENELRRQHADEFNKQSWDERKAIVDSADRVARGGTEDPKLPAYYYRLEVERRTLLASPRLHAD